MAHGGMRQKNFNFYEETLRVPLVYSNPRCGRARRPRRRWSPTSTSCRRWRAWSTRPSSARDDWQGVDYSEHILERTAPPPQDYVVFTFDDYQAGQAGGLYVRPPQHIVSIRETRWKLAEYYDADGKVPSQWEMYDLKRDPLERKNLAYDGYNRTPTQQKQYLRLRRKLAKVKAQRLQPLPNTPQPEYQGTPTKTAPLGSLD